MEFACFASQAVCCLRREIGIREQDLWSGGQPVGGGHDTGTTGVDE